LCLDEEAIDGDVGSEYASMLSRHLIEYLPGSFEYNYCGLAATRLGRFGLKVGPKYKMLRSITESIQLMYWFITRQSTNSKISIPNSCQSQQQEHILKGIARPINSSMTLRSALAIGDILL